MTTSWLCHVPVTSDDPSPPCKDWFCLWNEQVTVPWKQMATNPGLFPPVSGFRWGGAGLCPLLTWSMCQNWITLGHAGPEIQSLAMFLI